jgi:hypothetical protein
MGDETVMQKKQVVEGVKAFGTLLQKFFRRILDWMLSPLADLTILGKTVAVAATLSALIFVGLIFFDASHFDLVRDQSAIVTGKTVNVRSLPTTKSKILARVNAGHSFVVIGSEEKWTQLRSTDAKLEGWIASSLLDTKMERTFEYRYILKGYILAFIVSIVVFFFAMKLKADKSQK